MKHAQYRGMRIDDWSIVTSLLTNHSYSRNFNCEGCNYNVLRNNYQSYRASALLNLCQSVDNVHIAIFYCVQLSRFTLVDSFEPICAILIGSIHRIVMV